MGHGDRGGGKEWLGTLARPLDPLPRSPLLCPLPLDTSHHLSAADAYLPAPSRCLGHGGKQRVAASITDTYNTGKF